MKSLRIFPIIVMFACLAFSAGASAAVIDPNAQIVLLRYDDPAKTDDGCQTGGVLLDNCFTNVGDLMFWITGTRMPTAAAPLTVEIGPGDFGHLEWRCSSGQGHVSFRGAGRGRTIFSNSANLSKAAFFSKCDALTFESLTISGAFIAVTWGGRGSSTWTDVEMLASYATWYETTANDLTGTGGYVCGSGLQGTHKYFSSTFKLTNPGPAGALAFQNNCGKNWLWGSEIVLDAPAATLTGAAAGIRSKGAGNEMHLYGSNLRLFSGETSAITSLSAVVALDSAEVHIHGTGIDVISMTGKDIVVLSAANGGEIHANESAYVLKTSAPGTVTRIDNSNGTGHIHAPYLWEHIPDPATIPNFTSANGADQTTVTSGTSDGHPHTVVYSTNCPSNARWYDQVDKVCRP